jgi:hypothetical protein
MKKETAKLCSMESFQGIRKYKKESPKTPIARTFVPRGGIDPYVTKEQVIKEVAKFIADLLYKNRDRLKNVDIKK